jgi:pyrroloquinoline-quinone synthase
VAAIGAADMIAGVTAPQPWPPAEFEARLRAIGAGRYHDKHPFNVRMHEGRLSRGEIQTWVRNRYYYQTRIPVKDSAILTKAGDPAFRREWVQRLHDHDGRAPGEGGLELWLRLAETVGLDREEVARLEGILPGVRRACDAYVELVEQSDLLAAVAASLTELFAGDIMATRIAAFEKHYPWVDPEGLAYFRSRTRQAPRDASFGLAFVLEHAKTRADQERCVAALERKCEILWGLLDAVEATHRRPALSAHAVLRADEERPGGRIAVLPERGVRVNDSGSEILALCDGARSAQEIAALLRARHPEVEHLEADVHDFLEQMTRLGVVVPR